MSGPCLSVLVPREISSADESRVRAMIGAVASKVEGNDFWIARCPFFVRFGEPELEDQALVLDGWHPKGEVAYRAMTRTQTGHVLLGALCLRTAELLGGPIVLGDLTALTQDPSVLTYDGRRPIGALGYIVNAEFLGYWMSSPEFRLAA